MGVVQDLVSDVLRRGAFDASQQDVLLWLNRRHRKMVALSKCYRYAVLTATVPGQRDYPLSNAAVEILEVKVGGRIAGRAAHRDLSNVDDLRFGGGWLFAQDESQAGAREVALIPTPTEALPLEIYGAFVPPDLSLTDDSTLKVGPDFEEALADGAIAVGMNSNPGDFRPDLAQPFDARFEQAITDLRRQTNRRYRGSAPAQIRVQGINA